MRSYRAVKLNDLKRYIKDLEEGDQLILWAYQANAKREYHKEITLSVLQDKLVLHTVRDVDD